MIAASSSRGYEGLHSVPNQYGPPFQPAVDDSEYSLADIFFAVMQDPRNFSPVPLGWRPARWIDPSSETAFNIKAFMPYSFGCDSTSSGDLK